MRAYLIDSISDFLIGGCKDNYNSVAWAVLLQKTMNQTHAKLSEVLPMELLSRSIAYNAATQNYTCEAFMDVVDDPGAAPARTCPLYNMSTPDDA